MKRLFLIGVALVIGATSALCQDVSKASILINGASKENRFVNVAGESYLNLSDLERLIPGMLSVSKEGAIVVNPLYSNPALLLGLLNNSGSAPSSSGSVTESRIDGEFEGWEGDTIFPLINGQIWQQDEYAYTYHYAYRPKVTIYSTSHGWMMKVEGVGEARGVKRIR